MNPTNPNVCKCRWRWGDVKEWCVRVLSAVPWCLLNALSTDRVRRVARYSFSLPSVVNEFFYHYSILLCQLPETIVIQSSCQVDSMGLLIKLWVYKYATSKLSATETGFWPSYHPHPWGARSRKLIKRFLNWNFLSAIEWFTMVKNKGVGYFHAWIKEFKAIIILERKTRFVFNLVPQKVIEPK